MKINDQLAKWLGKDQTERLQSFIDLPANWDARNAQALKPESFQALEDYAKYNPPLHDSVRMYMTTSGTLTLEWYEDGDPDDFGQIEFDGQLITGWSINPNAAQILQLQGEQLRLMQTRTMELETKCQRLEEECENLALLRERDE